jgi:hypothetical protein
MKATTYAPKGLSKEALRLWHSVTKTWVMDGAAYILLANACLALDRLRAAEKIVKRDGCVTRDRFNQVIQHPAVRTVAAESGNFLRNLKQLGLDIEQVEGQNRPGRPDGWQEKP